MSENSSSHHSDISKTKSTSLVKRALQALSYMLWVGVVFIASQYAVFLVLVGLSKIGLPIGALSQPLLGTIIYAASTLIALAVVILVPKRYLKLGTSWQELAINRWPSWTDIGLSVVAFVPYVLLLVVFMYAAKAVLPAFNAQQAQDLAGFTSLSGSGQILVAFLTLVVIAPIMEEFIFRGYLYGKLKKTIGVVLAAFFTSLVFGIMHGQLNVGIDVFALSVVLCTLREVTGNIWAGVLLHMIKNGVAFYALFIFPMIQ